MDLNKIYENKKIKSKEYLAKLKKEGKLTLPRCETRLPYIEYIALMLVANIGVILNLAALTVYLLNSKIVIDGHLELTILNLLIIATSALILATSAYLFVLSKKGITVYPTRFEIFSSYGLLSIYFLLNALFSLLAIVYYNIFELDSYIISLGFVLLSGALGFISSIVLAGTYKKIFLLV